MNQKKVRLINSESVYGKESFELVRSDKVRHAGDGDGVNADFTVKYPYESFFTPFGSPLILHFPIKKKKIAGIGNIELVSINFEIEF